MNTKRKSLPEAKPKGIEKRDIADRADQRGQSKDTQPTGILQDFEQYRRAVRRLFADVYVMSRDFPAKLRFSYVVDRHGRLRPVVERRAEQ